MNKSTRSYRKGTDSVRAMLTPGEAVMNRNAAELLGRDTIKRLNDHGNMLSKRGVDLASLPSDPTPGPSTENMLGYQMGTSMVQGDDRADLLRDAENTFYGGGTTPMPTPTPTPPQRGYAYGTEDVRKRRGAASRVYGSGSGNSGFGPGNGLLAPEDNPAYQAAIANGRPARSGYTMVKTPSGGFMSVPVGQERKYTDLLFKGNTTAPTGFQRPNPAAAYALGDTGAVPTGNTPYEQSFRMGQTGGREGGLVQQSTPSFGFQVGNALGNAAPYALSLATNAASRVGNAVASFFGGGNTPDIVPSANAGQPSPTPIQTPVPSPTASPTAPPTAVGTPPPFGQTTWSDIGIGARNLGTALQDQVTQARRYSDYY